MQEVGDALLERLRLGETSGQDLTVAAEQLAHGKEEDLFLVVEMVMQGGKVYPCRLRNLARGRVIEPIGTVKGASTPRNRRPINNELAPDFTTNPLHALSFLDRPRKRK